jgi:hypothetical protein
MRQCQPLREHMLVRQHGRSSLLSLRREATQRQTRQFWRRVRWDVAEIRKMVFS